VPDVTSPGRRERKKAATRALISDTATRLFLERGFDGVTVKEIADAADVSPTTVFTHFPTKESLVLDEAPHQEEALVAAVRDRPDGQGVLAAIEAHLMTERLARDPADPQLRQFTAMIADTPALREHARRMVERHEVALAAAVAAAEPAAGELRARALARFALGGLDLARHEPDRRAALAEIIRLLREGWG
jgi:AcrR family transcriptional regulator